MQRKEVRYEKIEEPICNGQLLPIAINQETMYQRKQKILERMRQKQLDLLIIYADREHGANFAYLTGFEPRFEEALLVLHTDGSCKLLLGNENLKMCSYSRIQAEVIHVPYFSLPNQPMIHTKNLKALFQLSGIENGLHIGIIGWKLFTSHFEENQELFDVPYFIVNTIKEINSLGKTVNAAEIFIHPETGARVVVNANEIAHYEYGASLASRCVLQAMNKIELDKTEQEIANEMRSLGQPTSVTTICATGERFEYAEVFPRNKKIELGDMFSITMGLRGGLTSRAAYVAMQESDMPENVIGYEEKLAKPYYRAAVTWYETVGIGITGGALYDCIEQALPQKQYHWMLNPGHLTADEEWMSSPIEKDSDIKLTSGMMFQMDIIPRLDGFGGAGAEDGVVLADEKLRNELSEYYPQVWKRFQERKKYMKNYLGICLKEEVLPMSDIAGYMRPYLLNKEYAFCIQ